MVLRAFPLLILLLINLCLSATAYSHGGGLNASGCHNERRTGGYHCHRTSYRPTTRARVQPAVRPRSSNIKANSLLASFGTTPTINSKASANDAAKLAASISGLERQRNNLLLKVAELEQTNKNLLLKIEILEQENSTTSDSTQRLLKENAQLKKSVPRSSKQKANKLPGFLKGLHRNKIRTKYGPPSHVKTNNGNVEWLYKSFRIQFSRSHEVIGVFSLNNMEKLSPTVVNASSSESIKYISSKEPVFRLPKNAKLDYTGSNWECLRGYRRHNNSCISVKMPQNAKLDYTGSNWECRKGYRRHGKGCGRVQIPPNAKLDYTGSNWECRKGYRRHGKGCGRVQIPPHAKLDYTGSNWECRKGYRRHGRGCGRVQIPPNAKLDYTGSNWECRRGYKRNGNSCRVVGVRVN